MKKFSIFLRAFEFKDIDIINKLRNDERVFLFTGGNKYFISKEKDKKWIEEKIFNNSNQLYLAICKNDANTFVGYLSIINIDFLNRKAEWGGIVIDPDESHKGYAYEAALLMLSHVFDEMGINRFYGYWLTTNEISIKLGNKLGFIKEGKIRDFVYKKGKFHDAYLMSILKQQWCGCGIRRENISS